MACPAPRDQNIRGKPGAKAAACTDRDPRQPVQGRQGVHTSYIEEPIPYSVWKHGKRGEIPGGPTTSHRRTGLRQRPIELLPEGLRKASITVGRCAVDPGQAVGEDNGLADGKWEESLQLSP